MGISTEDSAGGSPFLDDLPLKRRLEANYEHHGKTFKIAHVAEGSFQDYFRYFREAEEKLKAQKGTSPNHEKMVDSMYNNDGYEVNWKGGTSDELFHGVPNLNGFREEQKKFKASDVYRKIVRATGEANARRRIRCEYDGEWSYDNRWDAKPFNRSARKSGAVKIVKLFIELSFSCGVDSATVDKYGCFVAAVTKALEASGVLVEIYVQQSGICFLSDEKDSFQHMRLRVKRTDEYLPASQLIKVFSSNCMRRLFHGQISLAAIDLGQRVDSSLGQPFKYGKVWECKDDSVHIYSVPDYDRQKDITEELLKFITLDGEEDVSNSGH